jgi:hypothetical protein
VKCEICTTNSLNHSINNSLIFSPFMSHQHFSFLQDTKWLNSKRTLSSQSQVNDSILEYSSHCIILNLWSLHMIAIIVNNIKRNLLKYFYVFISFLVFRPYFLWGSFRFLVNTLILLILLIWHLFTFVLVLEMNQTWDGRVRGGTRGRCDGKIPAIHLSGYYSPRVGSFIHIWLKLDLRSERLVPFLCLV